MNWDGDQDCISVYCSKGKTKPICDHKSMF